MAKLVRTATIHKHRVSESKTKLRIGWSEQVISVIPELDESQEAVLVVYTVEYSD